MSCLLWIHSTSNAVEQVSNLSYQNMAFHPLLKRAPLHVAANLMTVEIYKRFVNYTLICILKLLSFSPGCVGSVRPSPSPSPAVCTCSDDFETKFSPEIISKIKWSDQSIENNSKWLIDVSVSKADNSRQQ